LGRARDHARERRAPRYREAFERAWDQAVRLVIRGELMDRVLLVDEGVGPEASVADRNAARNRIYKAQERLRTEIVRAAEDLADSGVFSADEAAAVARYMRHFLRCQRAAGGGVSTVDEPATWKDRE
jgi:hypothetical protein